METKPLEIIKRPGQLRVERTRPVRRIRIKGTDWRDSSIGFTVVERTWTEDAEVELQVDMVRLFQMLAGKAVHSKTGRSSYMHGLVKAIVRKRTESDVQEINHEIPEGFEEIG